MKEIRIYEVSLETIKPYIIERDGDLITYNIFGNDTRFLMPKNKLNQVYITVTFNFDQPVRVEISKSRRIEHMGIELRNFLDDLEKLNYLKEENTMLKKFKIKTVKLKEEIMKVQLETSIETLISTGCLGDNATIKVDNGIPYLIKDGEVEELTGEGFAIKAEKFLIGKSIEYLEDLLKYPEKNGYVMLHLIKGMNLIESIELERGNSSFLGI